MTAKAGKADDGNVNGGYVDGPNINAAVVGVDHVPPGADAPAPKAKAPDAGKAPATP